MTDENRERLKIALLLIIGALGDIVFMPIGLVINIGLAAIQSVPLNPPPLAAFLFSGNVERLRVHLRKSAASNPGTEAANCNKTIVFNHI